jgi:hypothetical protein
MKNKYDIRINPQRLSPEQVAKHKNFDALLKEHQSTPVKRPILRRLVYAVSAVAAIVAGLVFLLPVFKNEPTYEQQLTMYLESRPYIDAPFDQIKPVFAAYKVNALDGGVFSHGQGTKLEVPEGAFVNDQGELVNGEVTVHYREMHDFVDFFLSGIPMTYDSAGVQYTLESAGMIEIYAEQDGKRVNMAPGKSIGIELISNVNAPAALNVPPGYNIYKLDESKRNWVYQVVDRMEFMDDENESGALDKSSPVYGARQTYNQKLKAIALNGETEMAKIEASLPKPKQPAKPEKVTNKDYVFELDFNDLRKPGATGAFADAQKELAELYRQYEKTLWQLSPASSISPKQLQQSFSTVTGISIRKMNEKDFEILLEKPGEKLTIVANPVLSGSDYEKALTNFNRDFEAYQKQITERENKLAAQKEALRKEIEEARRLAEMNYQEAIASLQSQGRNFEATNEIIKRRVVNRFMANGFGIWNCDRPLPPDMLILKGKFRDEQGNPYKNVEAYYVDKTRNTVSKFLATDGARMNLTLHSEKLLWLVTPDNKIALYRPEDFRAINKKTEEHTFVLTKIDREIKDESDVREVLTL